MKDLKTIILGCKKGDRIAQQALYDLLCKKLLLICYRYAPTKDEAMDILHDSFIRIFDKIDSFDLDFGVGKFSSWSSKVCVNVSLKYLEKSKKFINLISEHDISLSDSITVGVNIDDLEVKDLIGCISQLPLGQKTVFNLYAIDGYSHSEISERMNISESASRSQLAKARLRLKTIMKIQDDYLLKR